MFGNKVQCDLTIPCECNMLPQERLLLYALVRAYTPECVLEVGPNYGGSTWIIEQALQDAGHKYEMVSQDLDLSNAKQEHFKNVVFLQGDSRLGLSNARSAVGRDFDFVFLDASHEYEMVINDLSVIAKVTQPSAVVVLHDSGYPPLAKAIADSLSTPGSPYMDCGKLSRTTRPWKDSEVYGMYEIRRRSE